MTTFLFSDCIFGPIHSRRFGNSLGINLLPTEAKFCNFDCVYCECGWSDSSRLHGLQFPSREQVKKQLERQLVDCHRKNITVDSITFAGNGEPTIHPQFAEIIDDVIELRNHYANAVRVAVLSNASVVHKPRVLNALLKIDMPVLKLDAGSDEMFHLIDRPAQNLTVEKLIRRLKQFKGRAIIQTLFMRGNYHGEILDNTTEQEIQLWLKSLQQIQPSYVMIYSIARDTPANNLEIILEPELQSIANQVQAIGIDARVYG